MYMCVCIGLMLTRESEREEVSMIENNKKIGKH